MREPGPSAEAEGIAALSGRTETSRRRALARAISRVEAGDIDARREARGLVWPKRARVIGITGPPGVGKSLLASRLAALLSGEGRPVGVLAVDPTSPRTGGALLGDRVRLPADDGAVFFRSMAARGGAGGIAPGVPLVLRLLAAAGFERILLETAGVGQGDHQVTRIADRTVAAVAPGLGDSVQAAKAGLFEVADFLVVNQADRPGAEAMAAAFRSFREGPVMLASAKTGTGVPDLLGALERSLATAEVPAIASLPESSACGAAAVSSAAKAALGGGAIRLHHVGIAVKDAQASASVWQELLALREQARYRVDEFGVLALFLEAGRDSGGLIELVEPTAPEGPVARFLSRRGEGLHHLCFEVEDIHRTLGALAARGVRLVDRAPRRGAGGHLVAFIHPASAGGVLLELKQA